MTADPPKRVWLLGAGFSRSLGGPLMADLLSLSARRRILTTFSDHIKDAEADPVFWLYHYGAGFPNGPLDLDLEMRGEVRWRDAEEFLEILDGAQRDQATSYLVHDTFEALKRGARAGAVAVQRYPSVFDSPHSEPKQLVKLARRMIAASCCTFLNGINESIARQKERWLPYQQWLGLLRANDSILTFNYDRVVELLEPSVGPRRGEHYRWGAVVRGVNSKPDDLDLAVRAELPLLYKLHGSVDWSVQDGGVKELNWTPAMLGRAFDLAIATPGENKMEMAGQVFSQLWREAEQTLREAQEVFIIGFRFPASDAFPRNRLLAALQENEDRDLKVNVVLGPDQTADLRRVLALLTWTTLQVPRFDVPAIGDGRMLVAHSMWAEDFLSVWAHAEAGRRSMPMPWVD